MIMIIIIVIVILIIIQPLGASAGVTGDNWTAELFATNLTNEYAALSGSFVYDRERITPMRPRTIGFRFSYDY